MATFEPRGPHGNGDQPQDRSGDEHADCKEGKRPRIGGSVMGDDEPGAPEGNK